VEHCEFLTEVLKMDQSIRYAGMYNDRFENIVDSFQPGTIPHLSMDEMQNSIRYDIRRWETYKMFHNQLGDSKYSMVKYEKATLLTFSLNEGKFLRISIEPDTDYKMIIDRIQNLIAKNPKLK
jgi:hypothetical protein